MKKLKEHLKRGLSLVLTMVMLLQIIPAIPIASAGSENDSVFAGFTDWTVTGGVLSVATGLSGNGALITPKGDGAVLQSAPVTVVAGEQLRVGISVKIPTNGMATLRVQWYSDALGKKTAGEPAVVATCSAEGDFAELAGDVTVPENIQSVSLQIVTGTSGEYVADNAYIRTYSDLPEFVGTMGDGYGVQGQWSLFYPLTYPDGQWTEQKTPAQDPSGFNYAQIIENGKEDQGAVRFHRAEVYEHIGIAIGADMALGETYTLELWVKGSANADYNGLSLYANSNTDIVLLGPGSGNNGDWQKVTHKFVADRFALYLFMSGGAYGCDVVVDNIRILDAQGKDILDGAGNFVGDGTMKLGATNRISNGDFEQVEYTYLPLEEYNATFTGAQQVVSESGWSLNEGSKDTVSFIIDDNGQHLVVTKVDNESVLQGPMVQLTAGDTYQIALDVKTTGQAAIGGWFYDIAGNPLEFWDPAVIGENNEWSALTAFLTVPEEADTFQPTVLFCGTAGNTLAVDNVAIHPCRESDTPDVSEPENTEPVVTEPINGKVPATIDTSVSYPSWGGAPRDVWSILYETNTPNGTWPAWGAGVRPYGEIVADGHNDPGSLHLASDAHKNAGVCITVDLVNGQAYTLGLWAKGTSNSGRVLALYGNGGAAIVGVSSELGADWTYYETTITADRNQLNLLAADWGTTDIYIDNITLKDSLGMDLLAGKGDFCVEDPNPPTETEPEQGEPNQPESTTFVGLDLDAIASHGMAYTDRWAKFYPAGTPDSGTWAAWDSNHYGETVADGCKDSVALHLVSAPHKNAGVAIDAGMTPGKKYTLGLWAKGTSDSGRVLALYDNGGAAVVTTSDKLTIDWNYYEIQFTATIRQLNLLAVDWGTTDIYIDNIVLYDETGTDLLAYRGDFCIYDTAQPRPDLTVNLLPGGDFEGVSSLSIPGWTIEGTVMEENGTITLKTGAALQSLRYNVEAGQIFYTKYTGTNGVLQIQFGYQDSVIETKEATADGLTFSVPDGTEWIRVRYMAMDQPATVSAVELTDMGDPSNFDFELKDTESLLPLNWTTWTAKNDTSLPDSILAEAYFVEQQVGTGVDNSDCLHVVLNREVPENVSANAMPAVVDSIKVKVEPNTTYSFSFWAKMDAKNGCIYPSVKCYRMDGAYDKAQHWMNGANVTETTGQWKQYKTSFSTGSQTEYVSFSFETKASNHGAQFWIDRVAYKAIGSSLDPNLNFELGVPGEIPMNWTVFERNIHTGQEGSFGDYTVSLAPTGSQSGSGALKVQKSNGAATEVYVASTLLPVAASRNYYFSYDAVTTKASDKDQILIMLVQKKANGENISDPNKAFYWPGAAVANGYFNWSEFGTIFETAPDCAYIQVMLCFRASGSYTAYVDNVSLIQAKEIEDPNLDFEYSVGNIPLNWEFNGVLSKSSMGLYSENVFSGNQALRVTREKGELDCSFVYGQKMIPVQAGDKIEIVANIASRNAVSGHFSMCLFGYGDTTIDTSKMVNSMYGQERVTNAGEDWSQWDTYEMVWTVPKGVNYIQLCMRIGGTYNDMLIDDITVYNYTQSDNLIFSEDFKTSSVTTGLPGGWEKGEITGTGEAKVNGQMSLTGNEKSNVEIFTKLYSLKTEYVYSLTADVFSTGTAKGQLIMEAVNWDGSVAGQPVVLDIDTSTAIMELKADFQSPSAVYYRLILRKTEGNGSVCVNSITLRQTGEPSKGITWAGKWLSHPDESARLTNSPHPFTERHYFTRTEIYLDKAVDTAQMQIAVDDKFTLYINGMQVYEETRSGDTWDLPATIDIAEYLTIGKNVIAVDMFNDHYMYGMIFDGIIKMDDGSTLRFFSTSDTMMAAECLSNEMTPTRNPLWTEADQMSWTQLDYDISTCPLWVHADEYASIGGGGWGDVDFDPTEYSEYKIFSNEFIFPDEDITAGDTVPVTAKLLLEKPIPTSNSFKVDIWKRNTTSRICSGTLILADGKTTDDWPVGEEFTAEFELQIPQFLSEGKYTVQLENTIYIVSDYFINNKVGYIDVVQIERPLTTTASIEMVNGKATIVVNGVPQTPMWYARPERPSQYEEHIVTEFGSIGVDTVVSYIFLNNVYGDVWTPNGFVPELVDSMMLDTLAGNPEANLIVTIDCNAPQWWCEANPGEMAALSEESVTRTNASFASEKWKKESMEIVLAAIDHMMSQPYANNIIGFKITAGYTIEWNWWATSGIYTDVGDFSECGINAFRAWLTKKYGTDVALQEAWGDSTVTLETVMPPAKEDRADDYWDTVVTIQDMPDFMDYETYMAELKADTIEYFCSEVNKHTNDRLIVGTYAGYFYSGGGYEFNSAVTNVYFQRLLQSEHIDYIKSPWLYGMREIGDTANYMGPVDSLDLYGKLWIIEDDSRLNLKEMAEGQDGRASVGWTRNYQQSVEQLKRNFSYYLSKGMGVSFYNLMWDFTDDAQYYGVIKQMNEEMTLSLGLQHESVAEIALIVDGESQMLIPWESEYLNNTLYDSIFFEQLKELGNCGAAYDMYLLDDLADGLVPEYEIYIFLATNNITEKEREAIQALQKDGHILVWQFTDGIANGEMTDIALMEDIIGMDLSLISTRRKQIATSIVFDNNHWLTKGMADGQPYGVESYDKMSPVIAVADKTATPLAYHSTTDGTTSSGQVSLAVKDFGDWTCIYSAVPNMPQIMFRNMQKKANVHTYAESGSDVIYASNNYVALHSIFAGERTIELPGNYTVYDVFNRQIVSTNTDSFTITLDGKETRLFRLSAPETVQVYIGQNNGGTVSNKGLTNLKPGESMNFTFTADAGYRLSYLLVDGAKVYPQGDSYSFENIMESHTVLAHFVPSYGSEDAPEQNVNNADDATQNNWLVPILIGGGISLVVLIAVVLAIVVISKRKKKQV